MPGLLRVKRVYAAPAKADGLRVLADRLWPRGLSKEDARVDLWPKALAPSAALRKEVHADPDYPADDASWARFVAAYRAEYETAIAAPEGFAAREAILAALKSGPVTLLFGARDETRNNAAALAAFLTETKGRRAR